MHRGGVTQFNVVGAYPTMDMARRALDALEFAGIDAGRISLEGAPAEQAADDANTSANTADRDRPMMAHIVTRIIGWGVAGAAVGAVVGLIFQAIGLQIASEVGDSVAVQVVTYAVLGLIIGGLVGGMSGISQGEGWELTFQPERGDGGRGDQGNVFVAVHSDNAKDIQRAEQVLRTKDAISVSQYGPRSGVPRG